MGDLQRAIDMADNLGATSGDCKLSANQRLRISRWAGFSSWDDMSEDDQEIIINFYQVARRKYVLRLYQNVIINLLLLSKSFDGKYDGVENLCHGLADRMVSAWVNELKLHIDEIDNKCLGKNYEWKQVDSRTLGVK